MTRVLVLLLIVTGTASAQKRSAPFAIADNSFLVEEAFNQEAGIFQNILVVQRAAAEWSFEFTQEWPLGGVRHQLSYTVPLEGARTSPTGSYDWQRGTLAFNYRYQASMETTSQPAFSPRLSLLVPLSPGRNGYGLQLNLPASKQLGDFYVHANAGYTREGMAADRGTRSPVNAGASIIYRLRPMLHFMLESVFESNAFGSDDSMVLAPGVRAGFNFGKKQLVLGAAVPLGLLRNDVDHSLLGYVSYELPFK